MTSVIDVALCATGSDPHSTVRRINSNSFHWRKVNYQSVITNTQPGAVMAPAADCDCETILARKIHRCPHVRHVRATNDSSGTTIYHSIVHFASDFIFTAGGSNHVPPDCFTQLAHYFVCHTRPPFEFVRLLTSGISPSGMSFQRSNTTSVRLSSVT